MAAQRERLSGPRLKAITGEANGQALPQGESEALSLNKESAWT